MNKMLKVAMSEVIEIPSDDIGVLIEMAGYGISYWATAMYDGGTYLDVTEDDGSAKGQEHRITYLELAQSLVAVAQGKVNVREAVVGYAHNYLNELRDTDPEVREYAAGHFDSDLADVVVQYAIWDEIVYG